MFQPLAQGLLDNVAREAHRCGKRFGFGGIARVGEGLVPAEMVLSEHLRLGSQSVILSRTFYRQGHHASSAEEVELLFSTQITKLRMMERQYSYLSMDEIEQDHQKFVSKIDEIVRQLSG
jgi:hypothetical protein